MICRRIELTKDHSCLICGGPFWTFGIAMVTPGSRYLHAVCFMGVINRPAPVRAHPVVVGYSSTLSARETLRLTMTEVELDEAGPVLAAGQVPLRDQYPMTARALREQSKHISKWLRTSQAARTK